MSLTNLVGTQAASPRRSARAQSAIMAATTEVLVETGYDRLTIEGVAASAGVSKATVYRWWPSKARLVVDAIASRVDLVPTVPTGELRADVKALIVRVIEFVASPLGRTVADMAGDLRQDTGARERLAEILGLARAAQLGILYGAAGRAELPYDLDAGLLLDVICGTVLFRDLTGKHAGAALAEQLTDLVTTGQLPRVQRHASADAPRGGKTDTSTWSAR